MAQASLAAEGAQCISLGLQTPPSDIERAVRAHAIDIVGLSFSPAAKLQVACAALTELRARLDTAVAIWAGGQIWQRSRRKPHGVDLLPSLTDVPRALAAWRAERAQGASRSTPPR